MRTYEINTLQNVTKADFLTTTQVAARTAQSIFDDYFKTRPFTDDRLHSFKVDNFTRVYMSTPQEYEEYKSAVLNAISEILSNPK